MSEQWPAPTPRDEMLARVIVRGRRIRMINRLWIALGIGGAVAAGALGVGLGYSGAVFGGSRGAASLASGALTYYSCPATDAGGQFHHGDRVLVTGLDESGEWLQVRNPDNLDDRVWVLREYVDPDDELDLPVAGCTAEPGSFDQAAAPTTTSTPDTTLPDDPEEGDEEEDEGEEPTTTAAPPTTAPTTVPPTTPPTTAPTTTQPTTPPTTAPTTTVPTTTSTTAAPPAPSIASVSVSPTPMIRRYTPQPGSCESQGGSETATITAQGIANATNVDWVARINGQQVKQGTLTGGSTRSTSIGSFAWSNNADPDVQVTVTVTVTGPGGSTSRSTSFTLLNCDVLI